MRRKKKLIPIDSENKIILPLNEKGEKQWVPIAIKNKDQLVGYIEGQRTLNMSYGIPLSEIITNLCTERFNDTLIDGSRVRDLSREQLKEYVKMYIDKSDRISHEENNEQIYDNNILCIDCPECGMFYSYEKYNDIPNENCSCVMCGRLLILYTNIEDDTFKFDGASVDVDSIIEEILDEKDDINEEDGFD